MASIDDNQDDQFLFRRLIERSGITETFLTFSSGLEALDYMSEHGPDSIDTILLDINMPEMDGYQFLEAAAERFPGRLTPVYLMLTSSLSPKDQERAKEFEQVKAFLMKPLTQEGIAQISQVS